MFTPEQVETAMGLNAHQVPSYLSKRRKDVGVGEEDLGKAQRAFYEQFGSDDSITQLEPESFFAARVKGGIAERTYYRQTGNDEDGFSFTQEAEIKIGNFGGLWSTTEVGAKITWRHGKNFRRDTLEVFPFSGKITLVLNPQEELKVSWKQNRVDELRFNPNTVDKNAKFKTIEGLATFRMVQNAKSALKKASEKIKFARDGFGLYARLGLLEAFPDGYPRIIDLDYLRADEQTRELMDKQVAEAFRLKSYLEGEPSCSPEDLLHLEGKVKDESMTIEMGAVDLNGDHLSGILFKRYDKEDPSWLLDDIFIPDPADLLPMAAEILPKGLLLGAADCPLELDQKWKNQPFVRELIGIAWQRYFPPLGQEQFVPS